MWTPVTRVTWLVPLAATLTAVLTPVATADQYVSTGMKRIFATANPNLDIDGIDDYRVDVDVAVIDSGIDLDHPDLNVVEHIDCDEAVAPSYDCQSGSSAGGDDNGHGTGVAGTIGAIDNDYGIVGIASGARLWAVDVLSDRAFDQSPATSSYDGLVAGVKWVTARADEIEVAKMIGGCTPLVPPPSPTQATCPSDDEGKALEEAVDDAIAAGVVFVAGIADPGSIPASFDNVLSASPIADFDGRPGSAIAGPVCQGVTDDVNVNEVDDSTSGRPALGSRTAARIFAPGYCIAITTHTGGYHYGHPRSAPAAASPHVAGAAAVLASADNPNSREDVESIVDHLIDRANQDWLDEANPSDPRPLLDVGDEKFFDPAMVASHPILGDSVGVWPLRNGSASGGVFPVVGDWNRD